MFFTAQFIIQFIATYNTDISQFIVQFLTQILFFNFTNIKIKMLIKI